MMSEYIACTYSCDGLRKLAAYGHEGAIEELARRERDGENWLTCREDIDSLVQYAQQEGLEFHYYFDNQSRNHIVTVW